MRCCSAVVLPGRTPLSRSPWRTHLRSVSPVHPILLAIDSIAAHCDGYWSLTSQTMRTARSCTSGANFGDFLISAPYSIEGASSKPGAVQSTWRASVWVHECACTAHFMRQGADELVNPVP